MKKNNWIYKVFLCTFLLSIIFSTITNLVAYHSGLVIVFINLLVVIGVGILFDMIGTASLTANETVFHAMSSQKIKGSKETINLLKNKSQVSNLCNDVIGDVCGIVSGGLGAVLAISISTMYKGNITIISVIVAAFISALTVGGKAIFKTIAIKKANKIIFMVGRFKNKLKLK